MHLSMKTHLASDVLLLWDRMTADRILLVVISHLLFVHLQKKRIPEEALIPLTIFVPTAKMNTLLLLLQVSKQKEQQWRRSQTRSGTVQSQVLQKRPFCAPLSENSLKFPSLNTTGYRVGLTPLTVLCLYIRISSVRTRLFFCDTIGC